MSLKVRIEKTGDFYKVSGGLKRHSKSVSTMNKNEAKRIASARRRLAKVKKYTISFTGRHNDAIGKLYRIRVTETGHNPKEAFKKVNEKYEHITGVKINGKPVSLTELI